MMFTVKGDVRISAQLALNRNAGWDVLGAGEGEGIPPLPQFHRSSLGKTALRSRDASTASSSGSLVESSLAVYRF